MATEVRLQKIRRVLEHRQLGTIVLEDVRDPHNAAAVLRTCEGLGFHHAHFIFEREQPYDPRLASRRSSSNANKWLDYTIHRSTRNCLSELKGAGYECVATIADPTAESIFDARLHEPLIAVLVGNEERGLSPCAIALADRRIWIPMCGMVECLNLSVSAGIILFEISRQRHEAGIEEYLLPPDRRRQVEADWLER